MAIVTTQPDSVRTSPEPWQTLVKSAIRDPAELCRALRLPSQLADAATAGQEQFRTFVPKPFLARIRPGDPTDPLLLQVLPVDREIQVRPGDSLDPVGDRQAERAPGLIRKYRGRVLLITRGVCAIHCRYCFRRHFPYETAPATTAQFNEALDVVREDDSINEVILSGGDPLMMVDDKLRELIELIEAIPHVTRLRIHSRLPVVIPARVTDRLCAKLSDTRLISIMVIHVNHPREIDEQVQAAAAVLVRHGVMLLNQSVLLKGVNDCTETLVELSLGLIEMNCLPYYLHQLDPVAGAGHFEVPQSAGEKLVQQMRDLLPGYAVPRYVREIPGEPAKRLIT
ncbi:MAG: EF-P beta-lysylation protein EpmB [Pirellulaceae bacterium]